MSNILIGEDGVDFINIYSKGKTILGRQLSNFYDSPTITTHGEFNSIEGYWFWLLFRDERFRQVKGYEAKNLGKELSKNPENQKNIDYAKRNPLTFNLFIKLAITNKITQNNKIFSNFIKSTLPFTHFYQYGDKRIDANYTWLVEYFETERARFKAMLSPEHG